MSAEIETISDTASEAALIPKDAVGEHSKPLILAVSRMPANLYSRACFDGQAWFPKKECRQARGADDGQAATGRSPSRGQLGSPI